MEEEKIDWALVFKVLMKKEKADFPYLESAFYIFISSEYLWFDAGIPVFEIYCLWFA